MTYAEGINNIVFVRAYLDNTTAALPFEVQYSGDDGNFAHAHSYEFVFPSVAPGAHVVRGEFRSNLNGNTVTVLRHTTVVQFAP